jgi:carbonic anhydrase
VLVQLESLRTHPSVAAALGRKELKLHGWVYIFETSRVFAFDPDRGQFLELTDMSPPASKQDRTHPPI